MKTAGLTTAALVLAGCAGWSSGEVHVTCGSVIKLKHKATGFNLHSHGIKWGSGSGQQSVTAHGGTDDQSSLWLVKEAHAAFPCEVGEPVKCGSVVRLEHASTGKNLHTHLFKSPLTRHQEVSAFGEGGDGDGGDDWIVGCEGAEEEGDEWVIDTPVHLTSKDTQRALGTDAKHMFNNQNCPRCPIVGQQEVACFTKTQGQDKALLTWVADQGIYFQQS